MIHTNAPPIRIIKYQIHWNEYTLLGTPIFTVIYLFILQLKSFKSDESHEMVQRFKKGKVTQNQKLMSILELYKKAFFFFFKGPQNGLKYLKLFCSTGGWLSLESWCYYFRCSNFSGLFTVFLCWNTLWYHTLVSISWTELYCRK